MPNARGATSTPDRSARGFPALPTRPLKKAASVRSRGTLGEICRSAANRTSDSIWPHVPRALARGAGHPSELRRRGGPRRISSRHPERAGAKNAAAGAVALSDIPPIIARGTAAARSGAARADRVGARSPIGHDGPVSPAGIVDGITPIHARDLLRERARAEALLILPLEPGRPRGGAAREQKDAEQERPPGTAHVCMIPGTPVPAPRPQGSEDAARGFASFARVSRVRRTASWSP